jgi:creatinine amidohydrolase
VFDQSSWMDVERYLQHDDRAALVVGSCEQHAYLSLSTDVLAPVAIAHEACKREGVLMAPPVYYGVSPYFAAYPGTISLRPETLAAVVRDILGGLLSHGFRRILISNGHGGNNGILNAVLIETGNAHPETKFKLFQWWNHPAVVAMSVEAGYPPHHANWSENFTFTRLGPVPAGSKPDVSLPQGVSGKVTRELLGDGTMGGFYQAPQELSDRVFALSVDLMAAELHSW